MIRVLDVQFAEHFNLFMSEDKKLPLDKGYRSGYELAVLLMFCLLL